METFATLAASPIVRNRGWPDIGKHRQRETNSMKKSFQAGLAISALLILGALSAPASAQDSAARLPTAPIVSLPSWSPLVKKAMPAVVNISAEISPEAA